MTIHARPGWLSVCEAQQAPPVAPWPLSHELLSVESIEGIFLNLFCLKIALLLPLTSDQWVSDSGALFEQLVFVDFFLFPS